jgi:hypothetical protein
MRYVHLRKLGLNFIHLFLVERAGLGPAPTSTSRAFRGKKLGWQETRRGWGSARLRVRTARRSFLSQSVRRRALEELRDMVADHLTQ